jgi:hypothetical protein
MRVIVQRHAPAALYPQESSPGTHWIEGWVGFRAGLDTEARGKFFACAWDRTPIARSSSPHSDTILTELLQLQYLSKRSKKALWLQLGKCSQFCYVFLRYLDIT